MSREEIKERLQRVPKWPWYWSKYGLRNDDGYIIHEGTMGLAFEGDYPDGHPYPPAEVADFIEHAPEDIEWLLTELEKRDQEIEELESKVFNEWGWP